MSRVRWCSVTCEAVQCHVRVGAGLRVKTHTDLVCVNRTYCVGSSAHLSEGAGAARDRK